MKLRLIERDGSVNFVDYEGTQLPASVLVQRPFHQVIGTRFDLWSEPLRTYHFRQNECLPAPRRLAR